MQQATTYTHKIKSSGQRCFFVGMWPTVDKTYKAQDKKWPLMMLESGQITKVRRSNLKFIGDEEG